VLRNAGLKTDDGSYGEIAALLRHCCCASNSANCSIEV